MLRQAAGWTDFTAHNQNKITQKEKVTWSHTVTRCITLWDILIFTGFKFLEFVNK